MSKSARDINREQMYTGLLIAAVMVIVIGLIWIVASALIQKGAEAQSCENQGGHMYHRTVGKLHYYKCVTDDDEVIRL